MITTYRELPGTQYPGPDPAGVGRRLDPKRTSRETWLRRLAEWTLPRNGDPTAIRLWRVTVRVKGRGKITRALPSGHRIRIFEERSADRERVASDGWIEGPEFWLTFADAEALWRDKDVALQPLCDNITVDTSAA